MLKGTKSLVLIGLIIVLVSVGCVTPKGNGGVNGGEMPSPSISRETGSPVLTVTQTYFPASECRNMDQSTCDTEFQKNATFNLTYTVGSHNLSGGLKVAFGYAEINKTRGFYSYYSRFFGNNEGGFKMRWAEPIFQNTYPDFLNYVTVSTTNNRVSADLVDLADNGLEIRLNDTLSKGENVTIQFHSILQPGAAVETDLMVLEDTNGDGVYQHVVERYSDINEYPKLIVTGWKLTRFDVIAPSKTDGGEFNITVRAIDEKKLLYANKFKPAYIIRNYTGTISFSSSDPDAILPRDYTFTLADRGTHTFNVTLNTTGIQNITVNSSAITGVSNPISVNDSDYDNYKIYWWGRHVHTFMSGHSAHSPTYAFSFAKNDSGLDVFDIGGHCQYKLFNWTYLRELPAQYYRPGEFVVFGEYEFAKNAEINDGHRNIIFKNSSGTDVYCTSKEKSDPAVIGGQNVKSISEHYSNDDVFLVYHHTFVGFQGGFRWQNKSDPNEMKLHKFIEMYSWHGSSEYRGNPLRYSQSSANGSTAREGIKAGYTLGIIAGTDNHFGEPGTPGSAFNKAHNGLTAIYAKNLTVDGIWEALDNRRTYGTTDARAIIEFKTSNGYMMGSSNVSMSNITLDARVVGTGTIDTIAIMRNGTDQVYTYSGSSFDESFNWTDTNTTVGNTYSYYLWFNQTDGVTYGWSSPIWITKVP